jgi:hypothetical protein
LRQHETARKGRRPTELLVRALKVQRFSEWETLHENIATAALNQPGDEGRAYGRRKAILQR